MSRKERRAAKKAEVKARKAFDKSMSKVARERTPISLANYWTWGWVTPANLFICPVVLNAVQFPVGIGVWTKESLVESKVRAEKAISEKMPLEYGQEPYHYQLGQELDPTVFGQSALHMFRQALFSMSMGKIKDAAEDEFRTSLVFIDPPLMKIDDEILVVMAKQDKLRLISCIEDWDIDQICSWRPEEASASEGTDG
jgi:hypothetical protein